MRHRTFPSPTPELLRVIAREMRKLRIVNDEGCLKEWESEGYVLVCGGKAEIIKALQAVVKRDFSTLKTDSKREEYSFEYVVAPGEGHRLGLGIMTRLFKRGEPRSIWYGRYILRVGKDDFVARIDD